MAQHPQPHPSIAVRLSTSSPVFDLSQQTPFTINIGLTLNNTHPITFEPRSAALFTIPLNAGGLTFTNTVTGEPVPRNTRYMHYESSNEEDLTPSEQTREHFVTLRPGQEHVLHATLQPILSNSHFSTQGLTAEEIAAKQAELPGTWRWYHVAGMLDGAVYKIGVSEGAGVREWMQGSVDGLVEIRRAGLRPEVKREVVPFVVKEAARFEMRRPDANGSLDWP